jgi:hypothetical protein
MHARVKLLFFGFSSRFRVVFTIINFYVEIMASEKYFSNVFSVRAKYKFIMLNETEARIDYEYFIFFNGKPK